MRSSFCTKVYCRPSKAGKDGLSPLELSIIVNGKRVFLQLPYKCKAEEFNRKRRPKELQAYVDTTIANINSVLLDMAQNGVPVTAQALKYYIQCGGFRSYLISDLFEEHLKLMLSRVGVDLTQCAYRKYVIVRDLFYEFFDKDKEVTEITPAVAKGFYIHLQQRYKDATANAYFLKFHCTVKFGMDNGKIKINPFQGIKMKQVKNEIDYLTDAEIEAIRNVKLDNECLESVRDAFLLQVYSGLSYIDLEHLTEADIKTTEDGLLYVQKPRVKTNIPYTAVILPEGAEILRRNGYKLRVISNQKMNLYLKQIMVLSGIRHNLHTHLGRKTYGHMLLNRGVRADTVARCLGHSSSRTTLRYYAEIEGQTAINEVSKAFS